MAIPGACQLKTIRFVKKLKAMWGNVKKWATSIKNEIAALYIAAKHQRTPLLAKAIAIAVTAYALSPIDLIPDFIPILGYLDDLLILPLGIKLAIRLIPKDLMALFRTEAAKQSLLPHHWTGAAIVIAIWIGGLTFLAFWAYKQDG